LYAEGIGEVKGEVNGMYEELLSDLQELSHRVVEMGGYL
jgi:hypothetical protein